MEADKPFVDQDYRLEKFPGKGGWTYAAIPGVVPPTKTPFGWVKVKGSIDDIPIHHYKLMPMGQGRLFLPVKAALRKQLGKQAGDWVRVVLYWDETPLALPQELLTCFEYEPALAKIRFLQLPEGQQKAYLEWIARARSADTKAERIAQLMDKLLQT